MFNFLELGEETDYSNIAVAEETEVLPLAPQAVPLVNQISNAIVSNDELIDAVGYSQISVPALRPTRENRLREMCDNHILVHCVYDWSKLKFRARPYQQRMNGRVFDTYLNIRTPSGTSGMRAPWRVFIVDDLVLSTKKDQYIVRGSRFTEIVD